MVTISASKSRTYSTHQSPTQSRNPALPFSAVTLLFAAKGSAASCSILLIIVLSTLFGIARSRRLASLAIITVNMR